MPRRAFIKDLEDAARPGRYENINSVRAGADDGSITFVFSSRALPTGEIVIEAMIPEVSDYPSGHFYYLYTTSSSESVPPSVSLALESIQPTLTGRCLDHMLHEVSSAIDRVLATGQSDAPITIESDSDELLEDEPPSDDEEYDDEIFSPRSPMQGVTHVPIELAPITSKRSGDRDFLPRLRSDIIATKKAGFKVGILGDLEAGGFICISVRIVKLGISEEAMQAWGLSRKHYLVLMIRFEQGYRTLEQVSEDGPAIGKAKTAMRVALCQSYKPSITDAINAFRQITEPTKQQVEKEAASPKSCKSTLEALFIGGPLNDLLKDRFSGIVKYRLACGFSWTSAESFFNDIQGKSIASIDLDERKYNVEETTANSALSPLTTADHIIQAPPGSQLSMLLVAMQFTLRHFVRCTEFCLVCHCEVDASFEALKPYVCSKPLCLYQYMSLGFGPSIEWEILSQPDVVDLLVSFCYAGAACSRLREFPIGIELRVPLTGLSQAEELKPTQVARIDAQNMELVFPDQKKKCPFKNGDWMVINAKLLDVYIHTRVIETALWPVVNLETGIRIPKRPKINSESHLARNTKPNTPATTPKPTPAGLIDAHYFIYDQNFDDLDNFNKQQAITTLLDTLPEVSEMKRYLQSQQTVQEPSLKNWRERISGPTLSLLRWIIASNRSCIMQVDRSTAPVSTQLSTTSMPPELGSQTELGSREDRVSGMAGWMQFRFAQGAPDKEQRFIDCVRKVTARTGKAYPTIFAWHGSPLANWHSIVRQGLNYKEVAHGRAFGDGVYMSPHYNTSMGYSGIHAGGFTPITSSATWPNSNLKISCALSLNEVVNCPEEFRSRTPHYVVDNIDWIQTRYLFVKANHRNLGFDFSAETTPTCIYEQDPFAQAIGETNKPVIIPITAVSKSRRPVLSASPQARNVWKKAKSLKATDQESAEREEDDAASVVTDEEDLDFLQQSDSEESTSSDGKVFTSEVKGPNKTAIQSDFISGSLDFSKLKLLNPPKNASPVTSKALLRTLQETLKVQRSTPVTELGWYIHGDRIENVYQWIVEMHSFDPELPLAKDMKKSGLASIVLEIRFMNDFPFSPPFIRVIRPRFLPFLQGGGGHITAGGALCMELLTNSGWVASLSIESILLQVRMAMSSTDPRPARLQMSGRYGHADSYSVGEAIDAYKRACLAHGWAPAAGINGLMDG